MNTKILYFSLALTLTVLSACNEKEKKMEISPDMLFSVRGNAAVIELSDQSVKADIEAELMNDLLTFTNMRSVIEMKLRDKTFDVYQNIDKFYKYKIARRGTYRFSQNEMEVIFLADNNKEYAFLISGPLGNAFYNHFVRKAEATESHIVDAFGVFCLREDYTEYFQEKYPNAGITTALIRTDMLNVRRLETTKEPSR